MADPFHCQESLTGELREIRFTLDVGSEGVPGLLIMPREGDDILPLVLIQHPATSSKDDYFVRDVALAWAKMGWACAGLDAPYHGDRASHDPMSLLRDRDRFAEVSRQFAGEVSAVIDALAARYPIDLSRLGYVGYSMGSMLGIPAVAADGRFKVAAFCLVGEGGLLGAAGADGSPVRELGNVAVRIVAKEQDEFFSREASQALHDALSGERDIAWLPGGHFEIGPDVIQKAFEWVKPRL
jgi:dienelactone hydrolase